jgi:plastocyanin
VRRVTIGVVAAALLVLASCSGGGGGAAKCDQPSAGNVVTAVDFDFTPACLQVMSGAQINVVNGSGTLHTFTVKETDIDVSLDPGARRTVDLSGLAAGTYEVVCTLHPQMVGGLKVQ